MAFLKKCQIYAVLFGKKMVNWPFKHEMVSLHICIEKSHDMHYYTIDKCNTLKSKKHS